MRDFISGFLGVATGVLCTTFLTYAWSGPAQAPPSGNVDAPINVGTATQVKNGALSVNAFSVYGYTLLGGTAGSNAYLNFGDTPGGTGYGFRDNSGKIEVKDSSGTWARIATTTTTGTFAAIAFNDGTVQTTAALAGVGTKLTAIRTYTSNTTWTKPAKLSYIVVRMWGRGGGANAGTTPRGGTSSFNGVSASGGQGGYIYPGRPGCYGGVGGVGTGGDFNDSGSPGAGVSDPIEGCAASFPGLAPGAGTIGMGASGNGAGGGGGYAEKVFQASSLAAGSYAVTVGAGGTCSTCTSGQAGALIVYEYTY